MMRYLYDNNGTIVAGDIETSQAVNFPIEPNPSTDYEGYPAKSGKYYFPPEIYSAILAKGAGVPIGAVDKDGTEVCKGTPIDYEGNTWYASEAAYNKKTKVSVLKIRNLDGTETSVIKLNNGVMCEGMVKDV
jgi:hypothetical protein